jgi:hypothetical protein
MPRYRIFSNGADQTYNGYYNPDLIKNMRCKNKPFIGKTPPCADDPIKPPITAFQASTSYIQAPLGPVGPAGGAKNELCSKNGCIYPYGQFLNANELLDPRIIPALPPPFPWPSPIDGIPDQAILEYGAVAPSAPVLHCPQVAGGCGDTPNLVEPCLDVFSHEHLGGRPFIPESHNEITPCSHLYRDDHVHTHNRAPHCVAPANDTRLEMEWLKTYRFKCYQCINPTCSANALALQAHRSNLNYSSGNVVTSMTYGSTGSTRTTTTTTTMTTTAV